MKIKGNLKKATIFTPELFPEPTFIFFFINLFLSEENFEKYMN